MKSVAYFFAEMPLDFAFWQGMADIIREHRPGIRLELILSERWTWRGLNFQSVFDRFDEIHRVGTCDYVGSLTPRGTWPILRQGFPAARRFAREIRTIDFRPDSVAFLHGAFSLSCNILLKELKSHSVETVVLWPVTSFYGRDLRYNYHKSFLRNLYLHFFGVTYQDIFELRTPNATGVFGGWVHRENPSDYLFRLIHPFEQPALETGQAYFPLYLRRRTRSVTGETVVFCGDAFRWIKLISPGPFYKRLNELLDVIRTRHSGSKLVYRPHPGETDEHERLDLRGFERVAELSSEELMKQDSSISTVYSFWSVSSISALYYGIESFFLCHLFDEEAVRPEYRNYLDHFHDGLPSSMYIRSIDDWMSGKNSYEPEDVTDRVRASIVKILEEVGLL